MKVAPPSRSDTLCGRFTRAATPDELVREFDLESSPAIKPGYNIAPSQSIADVTVNPHTGRSGLRVVMWTLIAPDAARPTPAPITVRTDSVRWRWTLLTPSSRVSSWFLPPSYTRGRGSGPACRL